LRPELLLETRSAAETEALGRALGRVLEPGDVIALAGELGAGKTVLVRGVAGGVGAAEGAVRSPTFILLHRYEGGRLPLHHVDAYRLAGAQALVDIGLDDVFEAGAATLVEWAPRVEGALPDERLEVSIEHAGGDLRRLLVRARGDRYEARVAALQRELA